jgi:hypothetical protein
MNGATPEREGGQPMTRNTTSPSEMSGPQRTGAPELVARPAVPARPDAAAGGPRWTGGRVASVLAGGLLMLLAVALLSAAGVAVWANTHRNAAGYVTTGVHRFSAAGSAVVTEPIDLRATGTGWWYSPAVLGDVQIHVTSANEASRIFVGIGPSVQVDGYLAGVSRTVVADFRTDRAAAIAGGTAATAPGEQDFWVASTSGAGGRTLSWKPAEGSWTVVVMNADGRAGVDVGADLRARMSALLPIGAGLLALGIVFAAAGAFVIAGAIRRARRTGGL